MKMRIAIIAKMLNQSFQKTTKSAAERKDGTICQYWDTKDLKGHPGIKDIIYATSMMVIESAWR